MNYSAVCVANDCKGGGCSQFMGSYESELILIEVKILWTGE